MDDDNIQKIITWVNFQSRKQIANTTLNIKSIGHFNTNDIQQCPVCLEIPRFPVVFACGHIECSNCYLSDFQLRFLQKDQIYFTNCPICRSEIYPENVRTLNDELNNNPNSKLSRFNRSLEIKCDNDGCNKYQMYSTLTKHELLQCEHRQVSCPAYKCPVIGKPETIKLHSVNCPLHRIQCTNCNIIFPIISYKHSCLMVAERDFLLGIKLCQLNLLNGNKSGQMNILLPAQPIIENEDYTALTTIQNIVLLKKGLALFNKN